MTANCIRNRVPSSSINFKIPFTLFFNKKIDLGSLIQFGSDVVCKNNFIDNKFSDNSTSGVILGYSTDCKGYIIRSNDGSIFNSRDIHLSSIAIGFPDRNIEISSVGNFELLNETEDSDQTNDFLLSDLNDQNTEILNLEELEDKIAIDVGEKLKEKDYSKGLFKFNKTELTEFKSNYPEASVKFYAPVRTKNRGKVLVYKVQFISTPFNYYQVIKSNEYSHWMKAMLEEVVQLEKCDTWDLVPLPPGCSMVRGMWIYRVKLNPDFTVDKYRARWVAKGFTQQYGLDYLETYSPVIRSESINILFSIAAQFNLTVHHLDVKCAYLYGKLEEFIYMQQPIGFEINGNKSLVCRLKRSIYGLKQSAINWFNHLEELLNEF
jgi:hypothetical protein